MWEWGSNQYGQLGDGTIISQPIPVQLANMSGVAAAGVGGYFTILLKRDGYEVHYIFVRPDGDELRELAELVQGGKLRPHIEEVFPLERAAEAHERLEGGHVRGKLVLTVPA